MDPQAKDYRRFTGENNAPRGTLVSKPFYQVFVDPDGDALSYSATVTSGNAELVELLQVTTEEGRPPRTFPPYGTYFRVWLRPDGESDWKALRPVLADKPVVTVTLTATDPGGLTASLSGDFVIGWESYPEVVTALVGAEGESIELTFDWEVEDSPSPAPGQFTVHVEQEDGTSGTVDVTGVAVDGTAVTLDLASSLSEGQTVTLDYAYDYVVDIPLQRKGGGDAAPGFTGQAVEFEVIPNIPQDFTVTATQGALVLQAEWDAVETATSYQLHWRQVGGQFESADSVTVTETEATITVSDYGEWEIRLQACNEAGCIPEADSPADEVPTVRVILERTAANSLGAQSPAEGQSRARSLTSTQGAADGDSSYTLGWRQSGADTPSTTPSQPPGANPSGGNSRRANSDIDTTSPRLERGTIDGDTMTFWFSEPLDESATGSRFRVTLHFGNGWVNFTAHPSKVEVSGNKVVVYGLSRDGWPGVERAYAGRPVQAYYYKDNRRVPAAERLRDLTGNEVSTPHRSPSGYFPTTRTIWLTNLTEPLALLSAEATGRWLTLTFDGGLNPSSVPAASAFTVKVNGSNVNLASVEPVIVSGSTVRMVLASRVNRGDIITVSFDRPLRNELRGPGGDVVSFSDQPVRNRVGLVPEVTDVALASAPAEGAIYGPGETISVRLTFTEDVTVYEIDGALQLKIDLGPTHGQRLAAYAGGSDTNELTFEYTVAEPDISNTGVAVVRNGLILGHNLIHSTQWLSGCRCVVPGPGLRRRITRLTGGDRDPACRGSRRWTSPLIRVMTTPTSSATPSRSPLRSARRWLWTRPVGRRASRSNWTRMGTISGRHTARATARPP